MKIIGYVVQHTPHPELSEAPYHKTQPIVRDISLEDLHSYSQGYSSMTFRANVTIRYLVDRSEFFGKIRVDRNHSQVKAGNLPTLRQDINELSAMILQIARRA